MEPDWRLLEDTFREGAISGSSHYLRNDAKGLLCIHSTVFIGFLKMLDPILFGFVWELKGVQKQTANFRDPHFQNPRIGVDFLQLAGEAEQLYREAINYREAGPVSRFGTARLSL